MCMCVNYIIKTNKQNYAKQKNAKLHKNACQNACKIIIQNGKTM